jgi:hypothetical protein
MPETFSVPVMTPGSSKGMVVTLVKVAVVWLQPIGAGGTASTALGTLGENASLDVSSG